MKRASYRYGIAWIAVNDEPSETELDFVKFQISVVLLADLFGLEPERVAKDVLKHRAKQDAILEGVSK